MTWMITNTGRQHHLAGVGMALNKPFIREIAYSLAQINRFNGHTLRPYCVAEHSLLVASIARMENASPLQQLAALLHDAHEAYTGDLSSPAKQAVGSAWDVFEQRHEESVQTALGIRAAMVANRNAIKRWDLIALATERRDLLPFDPATSPPWPALDTPGQEVHPIKLILNCEIRAMMRWTDWLDSFIQTHDTLINTLLAMAKEEK